MADSPLVVVTGGAGFYGSVLVRRLLRAGYRVRVVDALHYGPEPIMELFIDPNFDFVHGDVLDRHLLKRVTADADVVVHLAALVGYPLCKKNPELAKDTSEAMELIQERSLSFEDLESSDTIDDALVGRVMERFERSRLSTGARVSVPYLLLDTHTSVTDQIMKEYTEDTQKYYKEQLQEFEKQREEDDEAKLRIEQLRNLHRNVFMRHVHVELGKLWEEKDS